jgi:hypothetical protein
MRGNTHGCGNKGGHGPGYGNKNGRGGHGSGYGNKHGCGNKGKGYGNKNGCGNKGKGMGGNDSRRFFVQLERNLAVAMYGGFANKSTPKLRELIIEVQGAMRDGHKDKSKSFWVVREYLHDLWISIDGNDSLMPEWEWDLNTRKRFQYEADDDDESTPVDESPDDWNQFLADTTKGPSVPVALATPTEDDSFMDVPMIDDDDEADPELQAILLESAVIQEDRKMPARPSNNKENDAHDSKMVTVVAKTAHNAVPHKAVAETVTKSVAHKSVAKTVAAKGHKTVGKKKVATCLHAKPANRWVCQSKKGYTASKCDTPNYIYNQKCRECGMWYDSIKHMDVGAAAVNPVSRPKQAAAGIPVSRPKQAPGVAPEIHPRYWTCGVCSNKPYWEAETCPNGCIRHRK